MSPRTPLLRRLTWPLIFDVREGEGRGPLIGFAALLLLIIAAHTVFETARDALLLTGPGPRALGLVYMTIAICTLPAAAVASRATARFGAGRTLGGILVLASSAPLALYLTPAGRATAVVAYVASGVIASVAVPQFWTVVGRVLTLAQGRRLFGLIAAAGVLGGVLGSATATLALLRLPVRGLLLLAAGLFCLAGAALAGVPRVHRDERRAPIAAARGSWRTFGETPFLKRIAVLVVLSTATLLSVDYLFKAAVARTLAGPEIGPFVARYYLALNLASLLVQIFVGSALVRALGIATAIVITPLLLLLGAASALLTGGLLPAVMILKGIDGSLRHSMHRITSELVYLPVPASVRERAKPFIDGALGRAAQTLTGAGLLALGGRGVLAAPACAALVTVLAASWLVTALGVRRPYLDLLRRTVSSGSPEARAGAAPLDLESTELLIQHLADEEPLDVVGAIEALARRGRGGFVPALILRCEDSPVLCAALGLFGASTREDWVPLARRLLGHPREAVRMAAARALAMHRALDPATLADDVDPRVRAYAALHLALRETRGELAAQPAIRASLLQTDPEPRLGLLAAIADAAPDPRLLALLREFDAVVRNVGEATDLLARAAARQGDVRSVPRLVSLLRARAGRESVRAALVALGNPAFRAVNEALSDPTLPRALRIHLPKTLGRFGTKRAAERLLRCIEDERDGLVRYKAIRALGTLVRSEKLSMDRRRLERLCEGELLEHFREAQLSAALRSSLPARPPSAAERLLLGLLGDKMRQSLERAFRLLQIAHPREDIHAVYLSCLHGDGFGRANAGEFLDALLARRDQQGLRRLLPLLIDDLPLAERAARAGGFGLDPNARSPEGALEALVDDRDLMVAALSAIVALEAGTPELRAAVSAVHQRRPELKERSSALLLDAPSPVQAHA